RPVCVLGGEALVDVVVADEDDVGSRVLERLPQRLHHRLAPDPAGAEARVVPVGERASRPMGGEVAPEPLVLRRGGGAAAGNELAVRVEDDDVPSADLVAVVALRRVSRRGAKIRVVPGRAGSVVIV